MCLHLLAHSHHINDFFAALFFGLFSCTAVSRGRSSGEQRNSISCVKLGILCCEMGSQNDAKSSDLICLVLWFMTTYLQN